MYLLIDKKRMAVIYRHENNETLRKLCFIEMSHCSSEIFEEYNLARWLRYTPRELNTLYENLTGEQYSRNEVMQLTFLLSRLATTVVPSTFDNFEVFVQASGINPQDVRYYRYNPGAPRPELLEEAFEPEPCRGNLAAAQHLPPAQRVSAVPSPARHAPVWQTAPTNNPPKFPPPWL